MKTDEKDMAIRLRRRGLSYGEILTQIPVAKSTLSLWLRDVGLAKRQRQMLTDKKKAGQLRGALARRESAMRESTEIVASARREVHTLGKKELMLIGAALYWAEGTKDKRHNGASGVDFSNTDPRMIVIIIRWLTLCCGVRPSEIYAHLYIHIYQRKNVARAIRYWCSSCQLSESQITGVYFKRHNPRSRRHTYTADYYGTLRVRVRRSSRIIRRILGWIDEICASSWEVV